MRAATQKHPLLLSLLVLLSMFTAGLALPQVVFAADTTEGAPVACDDGKDFQSDPALCDTACSGASGSAEDCNLIKKYANPFINYFLAPLAVLSVVIGIIWGAINYITSAGDPQKAALGKSKIQKALIGLLAFIFLYALLNYLVPGGV